MKNIKAQPQSCSLGAAKSKHNKRQKKDDF